MPLYANYHIIHYDRMRVLDEYRKTFTLSLYTNEKIIHLSTSDNILEENLEENLKPGVAVFTEIDESVKPDNVHANQVNFSLVLGNCHIPDNTPLFIGAIDASQFWLVYRSRYLPTGRG